MRLNCPHCQAAYEFTDRRPAFCPFCGKPLAAETATLPLPAPARPDSEAATIAATPPAAETVADADPETIGGYRLLRVLGVGGMGKVYEARDINTGRRVALKLVTAEYAGSPDAVERFRQEGKLASLIAHPRCVFVLAADEENGRPYIVMELMPGDTLEDHIRHWGALPPAKALALILDVIEGLQEAHRVGVVHRDVKPSNCFFGPDGRLKIGDFGLSKSLVVQKAHLTKTGSFLGTPLYASPEQVRGEALDPQTDVYSVAATLYYLLTGRAPFQSDNAAVTLARIAADPPPPMRTLRPELSPALDAVVLRGLERDRKRRWHNLDEFADALRPFLRGRLSASGLGGRSGAFVLDVFVVWVAAAALEFLLVPLLGIDFQSPAAEPLLTLVSQLCVLVLWQLYFGFCEGLAGWSPGKWLVGLRVRDATLGGTPGLGRGLLRALITNFLFNFGVVASSFLLAPGPLAASATVGGYVAGIGLMVCTMRQRNGFRGLHELGSRTCVVRQPRRRPWTLSVPPPSHTLSRPTGVPEEIGAFDVRGVFRSFAVRGAYRWDDNGRILLGFDPTLGRQVVLWLRHRDERPLPAARREVNRTSRLRWLAAGPFGVFQWDAFVVPDGCSLPALVAANGRMQWPQVQQLLKQLLDELLLAIQEGTLPERPEPSMIWVRPDGHATLIDMPLTREAAPGSEANDTPVDQALDLLARVAVLTLEGRPAPAQLPERVAAPLPVPAAAALRDLLRFGQTGFGLNAFKKRLHGLQEKPPEVTRARRAAQMALAALLLFATGGFLPPLGNYLEYGSWLDAANERITRDEYALAELDRADESDCLSPILNAEVLPRLNVVPVMEQGRPVRSRLENDIEQTRKLINDRARWDDLYHQTGRAAPAKPLPLTLAGDPRVDRLRAAQAAESVGRPVVQEGERIAFLNPWGYLVGPLLWVLVALAVGGGLSYALTGIELVGRDGRPAGRLRWAGRTLLAWGPVAGVLLLSHVLDGWYWSKWGSQAAAAWALWLLWALWWGVGLSVAAYVILALRSPARSPLDRLAGTYLVPR
jgi:hypothetical protein